MERPPEPPAYGLLIEAARKDAGLSVREAARRAGISDAWWRYVVRGYQNLSGGGYGQMTGPADTVAEMARVVGIAADRLETEGQYPAAAAILRASPAPKRTTGPLSVVLGDGTASPAEEYLRGLLEQYEDDPVVQAIAAQHGKPAATRVAELLEWLDIRAGGQGNGTSG